MFTCVVYMGLSYLPMALVSYVVCINSWGYVHNPGNKIYVTNMGPTWVLPAPDGPMLAQWTLLSGYCLNGSHSHMLMPTHSTVVSVTCGNTNVSVRTFSANQLNSGASSPVPTCSCRIISILTQAHETPCYRNTLHITGPYWGSGDRCIIVTNRY